ncbi:PLAC8-domain-containing protein [Aspergillus steynii IBT 23096]|uniref:PLAC8-domain-containing protein n=1 Tax=Aspergillus steynii IBT 23096 TaxID=1392250 RepID=A0A2I2GHB4_9EURO|nr:PLAC8-domain-containing protein [Aspergillus steynii IBT 23096]PLB52227.1 PLAC8-domain-containing protein [Aspergillus steynii IBT 23096]
MSEAAQKVYRAWPSGPPTYHQANSEESRNITHGADWNYSLFDCCSPGSLCLSSCCLPCLTFGKTQARVKNPTLESFSYVNSECALFTCVSMFLSHWILQTIRRGEMRETFGIRGSCFGDCCATMCCGCCALIQEEKEMELRTRPELLGYQKPAGMSYP